MKLGRASLYTLFGMCIKLGAMLAINKIMARYLTLEQYGAFGQYQSIFQLLSTIVLLGMSSGITKLIAKNSDSSKITRLIIHEVQKILLLTSISLIIIITLNFGKIFLLVINNIEKGYLNYIIVITLIGLPLSSLSNVATSVYSGRLLIKENALASVIASAISLTIAVPLISNYNLLGAIFVFIAYSTCPLIINYKNSGIFNVEPIKNSYRNKTIRRALFQYSIAAVASIIATPIFQIFVRSELANYNESEMIGIWQGIIKISDLTIIFPAAILGNYLLPKVSQIKNKKLIYNEIISVFLKITPIYAISNTILLIYRDYIIEILFNDKYHKIAEGLGYQLLGDIIRLPMMIFTMIFLARGKILNFVLLEISSPIIQWALFNIYGQSISISDITRNYFLSYIILGISLLLYIRFCSKKNIEWI